MQSRPSYKTTSPQDRQPIDEQAMRLVHKKFPGTKWADMAAFQMLDNKCAATGQEPRSVPKRKLNSTRNMPNEHPNSPNAAEAYYDAAFRWARS